MSVTARIRRLVENALPWYDPAEERKHRADTAVLEARLNRAQPLVESIRSDYAAMGRRFGRTGR